MKRLSVIAILVFAALNGVRAVAQEEIRFIDRASGKEVTASGTILEESPAHVVYRVGTAGQPRTVAAGDVLDVVYEVPGSARLVFGRARIDEKRALDPSTGDADRKQALTDALAGYNEMLPDLVGERFQRAERHVKYKVARLSARQAEDDPARLDAALARVADARRQCADGWQVTRLGRLLVRLAELKGDDAGAQKAYEDLAAVPGLPAEQRARCELQAVQAMIQGRSLPEARARLESLARAAAAGGAQAERIRLYVLECDALTGKGPDAVARLEAAVNGAADESLKATAYNVLGDTLRLSGRPREALWPYLWVDVVYFNDPFERLRSLEKLAQLFEELGDKTRARQYRERLRREES